MIIFCAASNDDINLLTLFISGELTAMSQKKQQYWSTMPQPKYYALFFNDDLCDLLFFSCIFHDHWSFPYLIDLDDFLSIQSFEALF